MLSHSNATCCCTNSPSLVPICVLDPLSFPYFFLMYGVLYQIIRIYICRQLPAGVLIVLCSFCTHLAYVVEPPPGSLSFDFANVVALSVNYVVNPSRYCCQQVLTSRPLSAQIVSACFSIALATLSLGYCSLISSSPLRFTQSSWF